MGGKIRKFFCSRCGGEICLDCLDSPLHKRGYFRCGLPSCIPIWASAVLNGWWSMLQQDCRARAIKCACSPHTMTEVFLRSKVSKVLTILLGHCFDETKDGTLDVRVRGDFFPRTTFGKLFIVWAIVRNIYAALCVLFATEKFDVIFVDQLSVCIPILRLNPRHRIVFYCHFPDKLLVHILLFVTNIHIRRAGYQNVFSEKIVSHSHGLSRAIHNGNSSCQEFSTIWQSRDKPISLWSILR